MYMSELKKSFIALFEHYHGFRRMLVLFNYIVVSYLSVEMINTINLAIIEKADLINLSLVLGSATALILWLLKFTTSIYFDYRKDTDDTSIPN